MFLLFLISFCLVLHTLLPISATSSEDVSALAKKIFITGDYYAAGALYKKYAKEYPADAAIYLYNYAVCLENVGHFAGAHEIFMMLQKQYPFNTQIKDHLIIDAASHGDWQLLKEYGMTPYWWYNFPIDGKRVLIKFNGGVGDVVHFLRYAKHLHNAGAYVIHEAHPACIPLLKLCPYIDEIVPLEQQVIYDYAYPIAIAELALTMADILTHGSTDIPYLYADPTLDAYWCEQLQEDSNIRVGLCWRSTEVHDITTGATVPNSRSVPLKTFERLGTVPHCSFYSLQFGKGTEEIADTILVLGHYPALDTIHGRFMDTLAIIKNLDLVITADTSIAHIAGALGVPVWVLIPVSSNFRWFHERMDTPWYPTMRLFRQRKIYEWDPIMEKVATALAEFVQKRRTEISVLAF